MLAFIQEDIPDDFKQKRAVLQKRAAVYGRVSSSRQKKSGELATQVEHLKRYCRDENYQAIEVFSDVGSGLRDSRKGLLRLLKRVSSGQIDVVVASYNDRISGFGMGLFKAFLSSWDVELDVIHPVILQDSPHAELITDLTAILYSFMERLYRMRRGAC